MSVSPRNRTASEKSFHICLVLMIWQKDNVSSGNFVVHLNTMPVPVKETKLLKSPEEIIS